MPAWLEGGPEPERSACLALQSIAGRSRAGPRCSVPCDGAGDRKKKIQDFITRLAGMAEDKSMDSYGWALLTIPLRKKYR